MRQYACRLALAAALAALLVAQSADACLIERYVHYQRIFDGPLPAAGGGAWFALGQDDGSLVVQRLGGDGAPLAEVTLRADGFHLGPELAVDGEGRFLVAPWRRDDESRVTERRLAVFEPHSRNRGTTGRTRRSRARISSYDPRTRRFSPKTATSARFLFAGRASPHRSGGADKLPPP